MRPIGKILLTLLAILIGLGAFAFTGRIEQSREPDPTGSYFVIVSHRPYQYLPSIGLGTGSDSPCLIAIEDTAGISLGEIPVPMLQLAGVRWTPNGAEIQNVGAWDFLAGTCFYWSEDQKTRIYIRK